MLEGVDAETVQPLGKPLDIAPSDAFLLKGVAFGPDGKTIRSCNYGGTSRMWDVITGRAVGKPLRHPGWVLAVAFSRDGKVVLTAGKDNIGRLWDAGTGRVVGKPLPLGMLTVAVSLSPDGRTVFAGNRLWDATTGHPIGESLGNGWSIWSAAFSPDGKVVLTASQDRTARRWDSATGRPIGEPLEHQGAVRAVAFSPDGRTLCTGSEDRTASLWDAASGQPIGSPLEHQGGVRAVAFSPDSRLVLTGSVDRTARLWDAATGEPIGPPMEHRAEVTAVAFSPDGETILTASPDSVTTLEHYGAALWRWQTPASPRDDPRRMAAWVEPATGLELDRQGSVRLLDDAGWRHRRERLYQSGGPPATYPSRRLDPILFGLDPAARADGLMGLGRQAEAEAAYAEAIRTRPLNRSAWNARGRFYLSCGRPDRAAANFAEAIPLWPDDFFLRERLCLASLAAGDRDGFRRAVSGLLERFKDPTGFDEASRVALTCALAPDAVADLEVPIRMARSAVEDADPPNKAVPLPALGAALFRAGRFGQAIRTLEGARETPVTQAFLAMAHARLGHAAEARRWLARLETRRPALEPEPGDDLMKPDTSLWAYYSGLKVRLLRGEAEAVVRHDPAFPEDPFAR